MGKMIITILLLILVPLTVWLLYRELTFIRDCTVVSGTVVGLRSKPGSKGGTVYAPDIALTLPDGETMTYEHATYSKPASFAVGELVPMGCIGTQVRILHFMNRFGLALVFGSMCLVLLLYVGGRFAFERHVATRITQQLQLER